MRYLFRGLRRQTGEPVEGRVFALGEDVARSVLGEQGIVVMAIVPEAGTRTGGAAAGATLFDESLHEVLDQAGLRIRFDQLAHRYEGRNVWVLERHRIPDRVMRLVNEAIGRDEDRRELRRRIEQVLETLFSPPRSAGVGPPVDAPGFIGELGRLAAAMGKIERAMASISMAPRREAGHAMAGPAARRRKNEKVLLEIFESNLELRRGIDGLGEPSGIGASVALMRG